MAAAHHIDIVSPGEIHPPDQILPTISSNSGSSCNLLVSVENTQPTSHNLKSLSIPLIISASLLTTIGGGSDGAKANFTIKEFVNTLPPASRHPFIKQLLFLLRATSLPTIVSIAKSLQSIALEGPYAIDTLSEIPETVLAIKQWLLDCPNHPLQSFKQAIFELILFGLNGFAASAQGIISYMGFIDMGLNYGLWLYLNYLLVSVDVCQVFTTDYGISRRMLHQAYNWLHKKLDSTLPSHAIINNLEQMALLANHSTNSLNNYGSTDIGSTTTSITTILPKQNNELKSDLFWLIKLFIFGGAISTTSASFMYFALATFARRESINCASYWYKTYTIGALAGVSLQRVVMDGVAAAGQEASDDLQSSQIILNKKIKLLKFTMLVLIAAPVLLNAFAEAALAAIPVSGSISDDNPSQNLWRNDTYVTTAIISGVVAGMIPCLGLDIRAVSKGITVVFGKLFFKKEGTFTQLAIKATQLTPAASSYNCFSRLARSMACSPFSFWRASTRPTEKTQEINSLPNPIY